MLPSLPTFSSSSPSSLPTSLAYPLENAEEALSKPVGLGISLPEPGAEGAYCGRIVSLSCGRGPSAAEIPLSEDAFSDEDEGNLLEEGLSGDAWPGSGSGFRGSLEGPESL